MVELNLAMEALRKAKMREKKKVLILHNYNNHVYLHNIVVFLYLHIFT